MAEIDSISKIIEEVSPFYKSRAKRRKDGEIMDPYDTTASVEHKLVYDSSSETLEPVYFWILDFMNAGFSVEKIIDNFSSSPGSGHFSELGIKKSQMQQEAMRILGSVNTVIKSIINIIYDLKEFQIR